MEKLICSCCGAAIVPDVAKAFLTCEYCDTSMPNPRYDEAAAAEAAKPSLDEACIAELLEMGQSAKLDSLDPDCFGQPINGIDTARAGLGIPDAQRVYFLYAHTFLWLAFSDGLALTDGGLYYKCDNGEGCLAWDAFITAPISCTDRSGDQDGTLRIASSIEIAVKSDKDSRLARFLVDFHNHMYQQHTGSAAPSDWSVTEQTAAAEDSSPSLLGTVLPAVGALLGASQVRRNITQRIPTMHPTGRPTVRQDRRDHVEPPRSLHSQPHRPGGLHRPGMQQRPAAPRNPGGTGRPGGMNRPGGMGGHGGTSRPGGMYRPGNMGRPGGPGKGRR